MTGDPYRAFALHQRAQQASRRGAYHVAAALFREAADAALTPAGAQVLREKARDADDHANRQRRQTA